MQCKFCGKDQKLIKAHIIPKHFWQSIKINEKSPKVYSTTANPVQYQNGIYDDGILCGTCDNETFGKWDGYAQNLFLNKIKKLEENKIETKSGQKILFVDHKKNNVDYTKLKLFVMSILWRASITSHDFFKEVSLPAVKLEKLKEMLSSKNPGNIDEFSVVVSAYEGKEANCMPAPYSRHDSNEPDEASFHEFRCGNYSFLIKTDDKKCPDDLEPFILRPEAPLVIIYSPYTNTPEYQSILESISSLNI